MKQKLEITRKYSPEWGKYYYYGYKYVFFNLVRVYVTLDLTYEKCKQKLLDCLRYYEEVTIEEFYK